MISKSQDCKESRVTVFKLADLFKIYSTSLRPFGLENIKIHSTDLKRRILAQSPDLEAQKDERDVLVAFDKDIACALQQTTKSSSSDYDAMILSITSRDNMQRDIKNHKLTGFDGTFGKKCQQNSLASTLLTTMSLYVGLMLYAKT